MNQSANFIHIYSEPLLRWYKKHNRDLPWRRTRDPYSIWISEVMLQQTRVDTVIPYYNRFVDKFPTIEALADAPEEEVLKLWEGLGYYSRARNLQAAARQVKEQFGGIVPDTLAEVSSLRGVGPYTAGAILSIAYNKPEPAVDGNVMRVLSRFFLLQDDIAKPSTRIRIEGLAKTLIPQDEARDFNQALMELGATVCTPKSPSCLTCPVMEHCAARLEGMVEVLPIKAKAKPPRQESRLVALVEGTGEHRGRFLIRQRPQDGLLARMWELPHVAGVEAPLALAGPAGGAKRRPRGSAAAADAALAGERGAGLVAEPGVGDYGLVLELGDSSGGPSEAAPSKKRSKPQPDAGHAEMARISAASDLFTPFVSSTPEWDTDPRRRDKELLAYELADQFGLVAEPREWIMAAEHTFSHIQWKLDVYLCEFMEYREAGAGAENTGDANAAGADVYGEALPEAEAIKAATTGGIGGDFRWITLADMEKYAFPNVFLRIIRERYKALL